MKNNVIICDQEISLVDILVRILRIRKKAALAAVIGSILLGGYAIFTNTSSEPVLVMIFEKIAEAEAKTAEIDGK